MAERIRLQGRVQGVGLRGRCLRLARQLGIAGWVRNDGDGVEIHLHADGARATAFLDALRAALPPAGRIDAVARAQLADQPQCEGFSILHSERAGRAAVVLPDLAVCEACQAETESGNARRRGYAFNNCTECGPRLSIQTGVPWDREHTSMRGFRLCAACRAEFEAADDRRFHAQPMACADCGPRCWLADAQGQVLSAHDGDPLRAAAGRLREGQILAIKALGGFQLACDATDDEVVRRLRARKRREAKPFALMARDVEVIRRYAEANAEELAWLRDAAAPIVILDSRGHLPESIAPGLNRVGFMLPSTPMHQLLLRDFDTPLVMTSGNLGDEPPCIDNDEALQRLAAIADAFVLHDRPIAHRLDDSVGQFAAGERRVLRAGRGLAPVRGAMPFRPRDPVLAVGGHLKSSFALVHGEQWIVGPHCGDLDSPLALDSLERGVRSFLQLFACRPARIACDAHPDYASRRLAEVLASELSADLVEVPHHHAHGVAVLGEQGMAADSGPWLAVAFDGLGYGEDGALWGGEFLLLDYQRCKRVGRLRPVPMPGGPAAMREPARNLYAQLRQLGRWDDLRREYADLQFGPALDDQRAAALEAILARPALSPACSSAGRLFDAVAAAAGVAGPRQQFEGQAAMWLESLVEAGWQGQGYSIGIEERGGLVELDTRELWPELLADRARGEPAGTIATRFHRGLAQAVVAACALVLARHEAAPEVLLSGGVFQNRCLVELCITGLAGIGLRASAPRTLPCNDGGLALGQALVAAGIAA